MPIRFLQQAQSENAKNPTRFLRWSDIPGYSRTDVNFDPYRLAEGVGLRAFGVLEELFQPTRFDIR